MKNRTLTANELVKRMMRDGRAIRYVHDNGDAERGPQYSWYDVIKLGQIEMYIDMDDSEILIVRNTPIDKKRYI